jgi:3-(3-hydroxy-phenyl)propionate hydroxylase
VHQAQTQPRHSIYYDYKVYPATQRPGSPHTAPVVIVGAGPIGLTTALAVARHGVACVVLESEQQVSEGSRAIVFTRRSMEILQQVGADQPVTAMGLPWRCGNSYYRGEQVFRMEAPHSDDDRFFPMINLQQQYLEETLVDLVQANPLIALRWGHRVTQVLHTGQDADQAEIEIDTPQGPYVQRAGHVVACDGARSAVRGMLGLKLEGSSYEGRFVIADIRIALPLPTERLAFFDPPWNPQNTVLMHREPQGMWRIDYQLPPGETPEQALAPESLRTRIDAQLAMIGHAGVPWELDWSSVYSARALTLPDYQHGRILFAGDAAHMLPIFGVRGANTGLQDAQNLAWKLAYVARGLAPQSLLRSYTHERVAAAREIIEEAGKSTRFMTPPTPGFKALRDAVLSLSLTEAFVRPLYHWRTSRPHAYTDSPLNSVDDDNHLFTAGPANGETMANVALGEGRYLMDVCPAGFLLLVLGEAGKAGPLPAAVQAALQALPIVTVLHEPSTHVAQCYGVPSPEQGAIYLIRPDQHVCARWLTLTPQRLHAALSMALAQPWR